MYANVPLIKKLVLSWQIIPVYFVVIEVTYSVNHYILFNPSSSSTKKYLSLFLFNPLSFLTILTHLLSMFKSPGYVPIPYTNSPDTSKLPDLSINNNETRSDLYCKKCQNPRPMRSHHCKICKKCTLKMDHHCHWIANCVGYYNQKNFYQFLFCSTFGDLIGFFILLIRFFNCKLSIKENVPSDVKIKSPFELVYYLWEPINIMIAILCSFAMTISIGTLFYKQTWMLLLNQTTIDKKLFENWENSPYYNEDKEKNFQSVMGNSFIDWISLRFKGDNPYNTQKRKRYYNLENLENED